MSKLQVLIVDDEWNMRNLLRIYLTREAFEVKEAINGTEALGMALQYNFDVILLDWMLPDMDGSQVCKKLREHTQVPIMMLTARSETKDKVLGLGLGADDYLTKPFESEELLARMYSLIRRSSIQQQAPRTKSMLDFPDLKIDPEARSVTVHHQQVELTQKEFDLFLLLARSTPRVFSREELLHLVWQDVYEGEMRVIDTHIKNIRDKMQRAKLGYNPIQTVWGIGYKFNGSTHRV
ncbi:response regulator transcription factor [Paenibacillus senegalimassiliensis]|uniref:response regulator transcription factor n=1 Tax=Paenibacillus senegalimassiliensis TaxID=1737426 RepID=UPI000A65E300|nr:response regulator transcription factor [Paenibacillus senegalimassiliensis]